MNVEIFSMKLVSHLLRNVTELINDWQLTEKCAQMAEIQQKLAELETVCAEFFFIPQRDLLTVWTGQARSR